MEFVVTTESGSIYRFFKANGELRVINNGRKEMQVTKIEIKDNCLVLFGFDFNIYGQKNEDGFFIHSTPIKDIKFTII